MACEEAPALVIEKNRLIAIGGNFLGIIGDQAHDYGYHLCNPQAGDYSLTGAANKAVGPYACAIDCGMNWPASRQWLQWLITEIREGRIKGIAEVIGSFDGKNVRYWSDGSGWHQQGIPYDGSGHDTWTHVAVYRSTAKTDHMILAGWTATGHQGSTSTGGGSYVPDDYGNYGKPASVEDRTSAVLIADIWSQMIRETSPYVDMSPAAPIARIQRTEADVKALAARPDVVLDPNQIGIIAQQVTVEVINALRPMIGAAVAEELANRLRE